MPHHIMSILENLLKLIYIYIFVKLFFWYNFKKRSILVFASIAFRQKKMRQTRHLFPVKYESKQRMINSNK